MVINKGNSITYILILLPICTFINDLIIIDLNFIKLQPLDFYTILIYSLFPLFIFRIPKKINFLIISFLFFLLFLIISIFFSHEPINFKIKKIIDIFSIILLLIFLLDFLFFQNNNYFNSFVQKLKKIMIFIFFFSVCFGLLQIYYDDVLINFGTFKNINSNAIVSGFNYERLFFCEFLVIGISLLIRNTNINKIFKIFLFIVTFILILKSRSISGLISLLAISIILNFNIKNIIYFSFTLLISLFLIYFILDKTNRINFEKNKNQYNGFERTFDKIINYNVSNWRFIGSKVIIDEFYTNPTFFGNGFRASTQILSHHYLAFYLQKHNRNIGLKPVNSHTFLDIIYDQGFFGFLSFIIYFLLFIRAFSRALKFINLKNFDTNTNIFMTLTVSLSIITVVRYFIYFQSTIWWMMIFSSIFLIFLPELIKKQKKDYS